MKLKKNYKKINTRVKFNALDQVENEEDLNLTFIQLEFGLVEGVYIRLYI